ncbi:unnamed protein product [Hermetia illucens]|uniref:Peptidase S1 domain-containing protein n=1 Tax=Hermetia illucens TaxID=343691 RepID=A0A7R8UPM1_HERIL|nr:unnamed protein product [Hermetia illucens]
MWIYIKSLTNFKYFALQYTVCCAARHRQTNHEIETPMIMDPDDYSRHPSLRLLAESPCGRTADDKIAFGDDAPLAEFPWIVQLQYKTPKGLEVRCGGSLISKRYVLTAAHCVDRKQGAVVSVRLGEHDTTKDIDCDEIECMPPVQDIPVEKIRFHPKFNRSDFSNDIAVIRLRHEADLTRDNILPICLPIKKTLHNRTPHQVIIAGWGLTQKKKPSAILQKATVPIVPIEDCRFFYNKYAHITSAQLCAGVEKGIDSCQGDSGAPVFFTDPRKGTKYIQYGVVSFGNGKCGNIDEYPGVYTRVSHYMKWILDQMRP